ncbi:MAG: MerR family transcriptional regulator [Acidobacteria bacterium]|nr:MerR family transcriptional regulator [Acidobacteriota bacterium]
MVSEAAAEAVHIGRVADRTGLSHRTIRHYEEADLVPPTGRSDGGFRLYTEDDVQRLLLIRRMKPLGYRIEEMKDLLTTVDALRLDPTDARARAALTGLLTDAAARRAKLALQLEMADEFIDSLGSV